jgi:hypothetical protein
MMMQSVDGILMVSQAVPSVTEACWNWFRASSSFDSRVLINAEGDGVIEYVDANIITSTTALKKKEWLV